MQVKMKIATLILHIAICYAEAVQLTRNSNQGSGTFVISGMNQKCNGELISRATIAGEVECILSCVATQGCGVVNLKIANNSQNECQLINGTCEVGSRKVQFKEGWQYYHPTCGYHSTQKRSIPCANFSDPSCPIEVRLKANVYIPFNEKICGEAVYTLGQDSDGRTSVKLGQARIEKDPTVGKNVLINKGLLFIGSCRNISLSEPLGAIFTMSLWIKCDPIAFMSPATTYFFMGHGVGAGISAGHFSPGKDFTVNVRSKEGEWVFSALVESDRACAQWMHLTVLFSDDVSQLIVYINGTLKKRSVTRQGQPSPFSYHDLTFATPGKYFGLSYWNKALNGEQIRSLYSEGIK